MQLRARRFLAALQLLTTVIASARRIHRSGPGSRALPAESEVDAVYHRSGFAVLLVVVTFVPPFISFCGAFHSFYGVMKEAPEPDSEKAAKESAAEPESSPESPLEQNEPPHEDEEQPVVITR